MKIGIEDVSISYNLPEPVKGKKRFIRRAASAASTHPETTVTQKPKRGYSVATPSRTSNEFSTAVQPVSKRGFSVAVPSRVSQEIMSTKTPERQRLKSAVHFKDGKDDANISSPSRPVQTPSKLKNYSVPESPIHSRPVTPNKRIITFGEEPRFASTSFNQNLKNETPIPIANRVRKELILQDVAIPWDRSCNPPDRDSLRLAADMAKNLRKQKARKERNIGVRPMTAPVPHQKTLPTSYSRNRNSKTSGPILNLPYKELRPCPPVETTIHEKRWNVQTKDRDDEERAKPEKPADTTSLHAMYAKENAYYRRNRPTTGGIINKTADFRRLSVELRMPNGKFR